jgi:hypothetical protein
MTTATSHGTRSSPTSLFGVLALLAALVVLPLVFTPAAEAFIYFSRSDGINRANLDGSGVDELFIAGPVRSQEFGDVAVDAEHIYWTGPRGIGRAKLDGTEVEPSFIPGVVDATWHTLAVDAEHVYWTHYFCGPGPTSSYECTGSIGRANLDGSGIDRTFIDDVIASNVAVDTRFIYWSTVGPANTPVTTDTPDTIGRARLDGTGANPGFISVPSGEAPEIHGLAVDADHLYWSQVGFSGLRGAIARANVDGTNVDQSFIPVQPAYDIAIHSEHIYWTQGVPLGSHGDPGIFRANRDGTGATPLAYGAQVQAIDGLTDTVLAGTASAAKTQKQRGKRVRVKVVVETKEPLTVEASGKIKVNPTYKLKPKTVDLVERGVDPETGPFVIDTPIQTKTLKLKPRKAKAKKIVAALKRGEKARAKLTVTLTDAAANSATETLRVRLKR